MAGRIRQSDIDEVKARVNIADVVGEYVTLKTAGVGSMKGLCPFHDERTPSFHVRPGVGFYHCFGCGESGDVYSFVQKIDHLSFAESVERVARLVGIELHVEASGAERDRGNRSRLLSVNAAAADFFVDHLNSPDADLGRRFLGERGFDSRAAHLFGVGFAPRGWDALAGHLRGRGFSDQELVSAGVVSTGNRGVYDRFRGRVVWPIRDVTGQCVGFGARHLFDDDKGPKYLNTPDTMLYHKSHVLYGLDLAKRDISRSMRAVVVEGYTDVMACHLAGVSTAIAACGTSFGVDHIAVLRRVLGDNSGLGEVVFTFDPDEAGQKAALRAFSEERRFVAQTFVAIAPEGLDPCDLRVTRGDEAVRRLIDHKQPMFEFVIRNVLGRYNLETVEGRVAALRSAAPVVAAIRDPALRPGYARELARFLGVDIDEVSRAVSSVGARTNGRAAQSLQHPLRAESPRPDSVARSTHADRPRVPPADAGPSLVDLPTDTATRLERDALMALLQHPELVGRDAADRAIHASFSNPVLAVVRNGVVAGMDSFGSPSWIARVVDEVPDGYRGLVRQLSVAPLPERHDRNVTDYVRGVVAALVDRHLFALKAELLGQLQRADAEDRVRYGELQRELVKVEADQRILRAD